MPTGTPLTPKCPKCNRGKYMYPRAEHGTRVIGHELREFKNNGRRVHVFCGHRAIRECFDCGHIWPSIHGGVPLWQKRLDIKKRLEVNADEVA